MPAAAVARGAAPVCEALDWKPAELADEVCEVVEDEVVVLMPLVDEAAEAEDESVFVWV